MGRPSHIDAGRAAVSRDNARPPRSLARQPRSLARPPALAPGDRVAVLSVSRPADQARLALGLDALRAVGLDPVVLPSARDSGTTRRYLAGDDAMRAGDLRRALLDPGIAGILFATGGSGSQRTLEILDWTGLADLAPKVLVGYSDVTAVLEAVAARLGWASVHGPMVESGEFTASYSAASLMRCVLQPANALTLTFPDARPVVGGTAGGVTLGGNLTLLVSALGTDTSRPARGGIVLIEDVNEADYRIDRMLTQLRRSGYLDDVAGIVCGTFVGCGEPDAVEPILVERLGGLGVPMITRANIGHGPRVQTLAIGVAAELDADAGTLRFLEPPLVPVGPRSPWLS
jgi:muramoyltetrapeptide carboxypeptidase